MANLRVDKITSTETFETTGSVQFDGNGDHLDVGSAGDFNYLHNGAASFTAEFWVYPQLVNSRQIIFSTGGNSSTTGFVIRIMSSGSSGSSNGYFVSAQTSKGSDGNYLYWDSDPTRLDADTWYHIATVYDHTYNTLKIYVNGKLTNSGHSRTYGTFSSHSTSNSTHSLHIGEEPYNNSKDLKGHLSNLRILNGVKLYTSNFKIPMRELENVPGTVLLCCQSKTDASLEKTGKTITVNGNAVASELTPGILTPVVKSGGGSAITGSVEFNGTGDYLSIPDSTDFTLGTGDFTIEFWRYRSRVTEVESYITKYNNINSTQSFWFGSLSSGREDFAWYSGSSSYAIVSAADVAQSNEWGHLAAVRYNGDITVYLNGVAIGSDTSANAAASFNDDSNPLIIGGDNHNGSTFDFQGFISNLRIVRGTALYTEHFIPPTRELKRVPGTVLLCCQDPNNPLTEVTGKTITGYGNLQRADGVELVTNGTFGSDVSGWTGQNATLSFSSGNLLITADSGTYSSANQAITTVVGQKYALIVDIISDAGTPSIAVYSSGWAAQGGDVFYLVTSTGRQQHIFTATSTTSTISLQTSGANSTIGYVSAYAIPHDADAPASNFTPQIGDDRQITFEGVTKINTDAYFYLPTGDTASREATGTYNAGTRGVMMGGAPSPSTARSDVIDYITIASTGDSIDFGNLTVTRSLLAACADSTRGIAAGGYNEPVSSPGYLDVIDYVTIASTGSALDYGDLTVARNGLTGTSNSVRGVFGGGSKPPSDTKEDTIDYTTIASKGQALDFGNLSSTKRNTGCTGSQTRGIWGGGTPDGSTLLNTMDYVTIASTGNAADFGDITGIKRRHSIGASSNIRGLFAGGTTPILQNTIDFITMSSMGNSADFGDLTDARAEMGGVSSKIRAAFMGGWDSPDYDTVIDFVQIATTGNAVSFGSLGDGARGASAGTSNGHGGLG